MTPEEKATALKTIEDQAWARLQQMAERPNDFAYREVLDTLHIVREANWHWHSVRVAGENELLRNQRLMAEAVIERSSAN